MKVAFGTVVYKEAFNFRDEFINSINIQNNRKFDTILLNDNLLIKELKYLETNIETNVKVYTKNNNLKPYELRVQLIEIAKNEGYDMLILGDFDDTFSYNRIDENIKQFDSKYSFFYNELFYMEDNSISFFDSLPRVTSDINCIIESNYIGLSTSSLNLHSISTFLLEELKKVDTLVFDWSMYTLLLNNNLKGKKIEKAKTFYRIHDSNIAGNQDNSYSSIIKEINIKVIHYSILENSNSIFSKYRKKYEALQTNITTRNYHYLLSSISSEKKWWGKIKINNINWSEFNEI